MAPGFGWSRASSRSAFHGRAFPFASGAQPLFLRSGLTDAAERCACLFSGEPVGIGRAVARVLAGDPEVSEIGIGGRDRSLAQGVSTEVGPKALPVGIDAL